MLIKVLIILAIVIVAFIVIVAMQPAAFRILRSAMMSAPPNVIFEQVNDLHKWAAWSPWEKMDPTMQKTFSGPPEGVGAIYEWLGNNKVGQGRMTILESAPTSLIRIKLEFLKPFKATNTAEFTFEPKGDQTLVTWAMTGERIFMMKACCLFMDMDKLVGGDFEKGLTQLKAVSETR